MKHVVVLGLLLIAGACGDEGSRTVEIGECAAPAGSVELPTTAVSLWDSCIASPLDGVAVVETLAQWDALFSCPTPLPDGIDLARERLAVVHIQCAPIDARFTAEAADEIVIGIYQRVSGACIDPPLVVTLPRSAKPVRLARCQESCEGECPPVP